MFLTPPPCGHCGIAPAGEYESPDGSILCHACAAREVSGLLAEADADELRTLRRRAVDVINKNPALARLVVCDFLARGVINF